jgi:hypothetical protein
MKTTILFLISFLVLNAGYSQENKASKYDVDKKCKVLVDKLNEYILTREEQKNLSNLSTAQFGQYVAQQLIDQGFVKDFCLNDLIQSCCYNNDCIGANNLEVTAYLAGPKFPKYEKFMPVLESDIQYIEPKTDFFKIKCCKPTGSIKIGGKASTISCKTYMEYNNAVMSAIAKHIRCNYSSWQEGDLAYTAISKY